MWNTRLGIPYISENATQVVHGVYCGNGGGQAMSGEPTLFDYREKYPHTPAARRTKTSRSAAKEIKPRVPTLREQVLAMLKFYEAGLTADECAKQMGNSILSIRPRFSELVRLGLIFDTGLTRPNESGLKASIWRAC